MKYCSHCGAPVALKIPAGDTLPRHVCGACDTIHYQNPKIVAGCIPEWEGRILLCRRAIEPRTGFWTFPAGFMELGESAEQAAVRETFEEARAVVQLESLYAVLTLTHVNQVYLVYRGRLRAHEFGCGSESLEVQLFGTEAIPWNELAFPVIRDVLVRYAAERRAGTFSVHSGSISPRSS
ncbi:MAG: NUDIX hydrolase [Nitrospirae bacterium]|nr:NUDIX hydrolase [Nitrospirota bacterium]